MPDVPTTPYYVSGMTCGHCENAVRSAIALDDARMREAMAGRATSRPADCDPPPPPCKPHRPAVYYGLAYSVAEGSQCHATAGGS